MEMVELTLNIIRVLIISFGLFLAFRSLGKLKIGKSIVIGLIIVIEAIAIHGTLSVQSIVKKLLVMAAFLSTLIYIYFQNGKNRLEGWIEKRLIK